MDIGLSDSINMKIDDQSDVIIVFETAESAELIGFKIKNQQFNVTLITDYRFYQSKLEW